MALSGRLKPETFKPSQIVHIEPQTRSLIGTSSSSLLGRMGTRRKLRRQRYGKTVSALVPLHEHYAELTGLEKKDLWRERERDEAKRDTFITQLADIPLSQRVYVDESGMDESDDYG